MTEHLVKVAVVSYSISTSNHNTYDDVCEALKVVSYSISTSNHNILVRNRFIYRLYLIPFLHQTTTIISFFRCELSLYLIPFLHQTTTGDSVTLVSSRCILFHFYIKPQPMAHKVLFSSTLSPKSHSLFQRNAVV